MKLAVGSDERTALTESILAELKAAGHELTIRGPLGDQETRWPEVARQVAESVSSGAVEGGILCCWTGTGVSIAANKVPGIRAALCADAETARGARLWNDANTLCLSLRLTSIPVAQEILKAWFETSYVPNPEDDACLQALQSLETTYCGER
jgi:ribose 5-phosphate isomerase B